MKKVIETEKEMFKNARKAGTWATIDYFFLYAAGVLVGIMVAYLI